MSLADVTEQAERALAGTSDAVFVMQVPSGLVIAAAQAAAILLDPEGGEVVGHRLEEFTSDEPSGALALFADGRINGYEATRTLARGEDVPDVRVSLWHKKFDHQSTARFALVLIATAAPADQEATRSAGPESAPVVGTASKSLLIEQISRGTVALFGEPPARLLGSSVNALVDQVDSEKWNAATSQAAVGEHAVTVIVRARRTADPSNPAPVLAVCEVILLPLRPGFTFVFMPATENATHPFDAGGVRSLLMDLSRIAGLARAERQKTSSLDEQGLPGLGKLTSREREMLTRLIAGYRVGSIAEDLVLSPSTVRTHLASVFSKLGVLNQSDLLRAVRSSRPNLGWSELYPSWQDEP
jgi:DNA-binding CsgD family transcriptional regulator